jgi:hypothetical protein
MEKLSDWLLVVCSGLTCYMAGVEWLTQLVNFPLLNLVGQDAFPAYQVSITRRIVLPIVIPGLITFKKVAHFERVGYKFDQWIDVGYWQLSL